MPPRKDVKGKGGGKRTSSSLCLWWTIRQKSIQGKGSCKKAQVPPLAKHLRSLLTLSPLLHKCNLGKLQFCTKQGLSILMNLFREKISVTGWTEARFFLLGSTLWGCDPFGIRVKMIGEPWLVYHKFANNKVNYRRHRFPLALIPSPSHKTKTFSKASSPSLEVSAKAVLNNLLCE